VDGLDDRRAGGIVPQRQADLRNRLLDRGGGEVLDSPDAIQQLLLGEDAGRRSHQHLQHLEGLRAQAHLLPVRAGEPARLAVEHEVSEAEPHPVPLDQ